jgi:hypothetical protein
MVLFSTKTQPLNRGLGSPRNKSHATSRLSSEERP